MLKLVLDESDAKITVEDEAGLELCDEDEDEAAESVDNVVTEEQTAHPVLRQRLRSSSSLRSS